MQGQKEVRYIKIYKVEKADVVNYMNNINMNNSYSKR